MIEFMGKTLEKAFIASSCIATESLKNISKLVDMGVEGVILKSCADYNRGLTEEKRRFFVDKTTGYTYASSPFELEILTLGEELELLRAVRANYDLLIIPSFTATSIAPEDWIAACKALQAAGADGIQLDFFYMGNLLGTDDFSKKFVALLTELKKSLDIPIMPKLNINLPKDFILPLMKNAGVEYVSLLDSVRSPYIEFKNGEARINHRLDPNTTSCFGNWQLPLTLGYTYTAAQHGFKVCAGGGITCDEDAQKLFAAGALAVQVATALTAELNRLSTTFLPR